MSRPVKRPSGKWQIQWTDALGKRRSESFVSEAAARAALRRHQVEADNVRAGTARPRSELRLEDASKEWLAARPEKRKRDDASRLDTHILPFLGKYRLAEITPELLEKFLRHLESKRTDRHGVPEEHAKALRPMTIKNVLVVLCKMLGDLGFPQRVRYKVPTSGYAWIRQSADVGRFLDACGPEWFRVAAALAVHAGLRKGEVAGLHRDALDFDRGLIRVDRSYDGPVKSKHVRWAPLGPELAAILKPWLLRHPGEFVVTADGEPLTEDTKTDYFARAAARRAGVESVNFHQLRHTCASHLAQRVPLPLVGAVLGHADPKTTARYAHLDTEGVSRDPRLHLTFAPPEGKVVAFPGVGAAEMQRTSSDEPATAVK